MIIVPKNFKTFKEISIFLMKKQSQFERAVMERVICAGGGGVLK